MTERLHFHFSLSCIREGNGNPLQFSCLENPRDGGAWWAAIYGVAQSRTRLKRLSSSSSSSKSKVKYHNMNFRKKKKPSTISNLDLSTSVVFMCSDMLFFLNNINSVLTYLIVL